MSYLIRSSTRQSLCGSRPHLRCREGSFCDLPSRENNWYPSLDSTLAPSISSFILNSSSFDRQYNCHSSNPQDRRYNCIVQKKNKEVILEIKNLPKDYQSQKSEKQEDQCIVCLENEKKITLGCGHVFCLSCVMGLEVKKCPTCRKDIEIAIFTF